MRIAQHAQSAKSKQVSKNATLSFCLRDSRANALPLRHPSEWVSPKFCQRAVIQWTSASVIQIIKNVHILATNVRGCKYKLRNGSDFVESHKEKRRKGKLTVNSDKMAWKYDRQRKLYFFIYRLDFFEKLGIISMFTR